MTKRTAGHAGSSNTSETSEPLASASAKQTPPPPQRGKNSNLTAAKSAKNDEFYTQWADIEREMNAYLEYDPDVFRDKGDCCRLS